MFSFYPSMLLCHGSICILSCSSILSRFQFKKKELDFLQVLRDDGGTASSDDLSCFQHSDCKVLHVSRASHAAVGWLIPELTLAPLHELAEMLCDTSGQETAKNSVPASTAGVVEMAEI